MTVQVGSYVMTPTGRIGLLTSETEGLALVMCGEEKVYVRLADLQPASEFDRIYSRYR